MHYLMSNQTISDKVKAAGEEGKTYAIYTICDDGKVILGETKSRFWNRLIACQIKLTFEAWAGCVWDALVDLSTGKNQEALLKGLSKEVLEKAQREHRYDWVVERLVDCYRHVCNIKEDTVDLEGSLGKSGLKQDRPKVVIHRDDDNPVIVNVNVDGHKKTMHFPDASGEAFLDVEFGITGVGVSR